MVDSCTMWPVIRCCRTQREFELPLKNSLLVGDKDTPGRNTRRTLRSLRDP